MIQPLFGLIPRAIYQREQPERNPAYQRFIRQFPCIGCGKTWGIEAMHTGPHGTSQKASDKSCLPGCHQCHLEYDKDPRWFLEKRQLDREELVAMFNGFWEANLKGRAA
jgi:hypothetical protein